MHNFNGPMYASILAIIVPIILPLIMIYFLNRMNKTLEQIDQQLSKISAQQNKLMHALQKQETKEDE